MSDLKEGGGRGRGTKRKLEDKVPGGKKSKGELSTPPLPSNGYPKVLKWCKQCCSKFSSVHSIDNDKNHLHMLNSGAPI